VSAHVHEALSAYLDGELDAAARDGVEEHLAACAPCRQRREELEAVDRWARAADDQAPSGYYEALPGRVRARLPAAGVKASRRLPAWGWAAAAALVVAVLTPVVLRRDSLRPPSPPAEAVPATEEDAALANEARPAPAAPALEARREGDARGALGSATRGTPGASPPVSRPRQQEAAASTSAPEVAAPPGGALSMREDTAAAPAGALPGPSPADRTAEAGRDRLADEAEAKAEALQARAQNEPARGAPRAAPPPAPAFRVLSQRRAASLEEARRLRADWKLFAEAHPEGPFAEAARLALVMAAGEAYRLGRLDADREVLEAEAAAYLTRAEPASAARVRDLLRGLGLRP
jgi:hypothetical protein